MKKIFLLILLSFLSLCFTACQTITTTTTTTTTSTTSTSTSTTTTDYIILSGVSNHEVTQGDIVDLLESITAVDSSSTDYKDQIVISSQDCDIIDDHFLDTSIPGSCEVTYALSVNSFYQSVSAIYTIISQVINPDVITVYFEKPENWDDVQIYYYDANLTYNVTWDNAPNMNLYAAQEGWYYFSFPSVITSIKVKFKDSSNKQFPEGNLEGETITTSTWFMDDYYVFTTDDPFVDINLSVPQINISASNQVFSNQLEFSISINSLTPIEDMYYRLNNVEYELSSQTSTINLGSEFYIGERIVLEVFATNTYGENKSYTYLFIKKTPTYFEPLIENEEFNRLSIYQIYVDAYQDGSSVGYSIGYGPSSHHGDLQGIINALDYIASLNVNAIWLTPVFYSKPNSSYSEWENRGRSTGYFADDYYKIDPNFGTDELFRELVDTAHDKGLYIFLDGVFGHHGSYNIPGVMNGDRQWYGYETVFPESLEYFIGVAQYWILEYGIDGWRFDQSYQLYQDYYNYWRDIRIAVNRACEARKEAGETWGTLGYLVGEDWESVPQINTHAYGGSGLPSAFNFALRYAVVASIATDESFWNASFYDINNAMNLNYVSYAQPNLFITNHDLVRFGDLLQLSGKDGDQYYARHKMALSFLAQYTGPITIFYGDEYGDEFTGLNNSFDELNAYSDIAIDNVSRTNGKITGFDNLQLDLIEYTSTIMALRNQYSAMYNGIRTNLYVDNNLYIDLKIDDNNRILYGLNRLTNTQNKTFTDTELGGQKLLNLLTGEEIYPVNHVFTISFEGLSGTFYLISD